MSKLVYKFLLILFITFLLGAGVTEKDKERGIYTIEEKLEDKCYGFQRWDVLFGGRQNVSPRFTAEGAGSDVESTTEDFSATVSFFKNNNKKYY
jgi:hypothetical protein